MRLQPESLSLILNRWWGILHFDGVDDYPAVVAEVEPEVEEVKEPVKVKPTPVVEPKVQVEQPDPEPEVVPEPEVIPEPEPIPEPEVVPEPEPEPVVTTQSGCDDLMLLKVLR